MPALRLSFLNLRNNFMLLHDQSAEQMIYYHVAFTTRNRELDEHPFELPLTVVYGVSKLPFILLPRAL